MAKEIKKWTTLESRYLIQRPWLTARVDKVQLPNGVINPEHYVLEYPDWVNIIAVTRDGEFVMVRQYRHAMDTVMIELCAGMCEEGETPEQSARRELLEETGYAGGEWAEIMTIGQNPSICDNITHCFLAQGVERVAGQSLDESEDIEVLLMTRDEVLKMLTDNQMLQALMAAPLWRYFAEHPQTGDEMPVTTSEKPAAVKQIEVRFDYYNSSGASGSDSYHFASQQAAQAKFDELRAMIDESMEGATEVETVDEPDFYGKRMTDTGSYAKVYFV